MGYPLTWQRFVNRNGLGDGDYGEPPSRHAYPENLLSGSNATLLSEDETILARAPYWAEHIKKINGALAILAGDLRRLEQDVVDEGAICSVIAARTKVHVDDVAAVLKEFMNV